VKVATAKRRYSSEKLLVLRTSRVPGRLADEGLILGSGLWNCQFFRVCGLSIGRAISFPKFHQNQFGLPIANSAGRCWNCSPVVVDSLALSNDPFRNGQRPVTLLGDSNSRGNLILNVGDRISLQLLRGDEELDVRFPFPPTAYCLNQSYRCSGFPQAFDTDTPLNPRLCGAPIVDMTGRVLGIAISCRGDHDRQNHVLPAALVQRFLAE